MNSVLKEIREQLTASGVDLDIFTDVQINISEARETVVVCRTSGFDQTQVFLQGESGSFYQLAMRQKDALKEVKRQNRQRVGKVIQS